MPIVRKFAKCNNDLVVFQSLKISRVFNGNESAEDFNKLLEKWLEEIFHSSYSTNQQGFSTSENTEVAK